MAREIELDEDIWGAEVSDAEALEASLWHGEQGRLHLKELLDTTISTSTYSVVSGTPLEAVRQRINSRELLALRIEGSSDWLPTWQFNDFEEGDVTVHPNIEAMWETWGKGVGDPAFMRLMTREYAPLGKTPLAIARDGDEQELKTILIEFERGFLNNL